MMVATAVSCSSGNCSGSTVALLIGPRVRATTPSTPSGRWKRTRTSVAVSVGFSRLMKVSKNRLVAPSAKYRVKTPAAAVKSAVRSAADGRQDVRGGQEGEAGLAGGHGAVGALGHVGEGVVALGAGARGARRAAGGRHRDVEEAGAVLVGGAARHRQQADAREVPRLVGGERADAVRGRREGMARAAGAGGVGAAVHQAGERVAAVGIGRGGRGGRARSSRLADSGAGQRDRDAGQRRAARRADAAPDCPREVVVQVGDADVAGIAAVVGRIPAHGGRGHHGIHDIAVRQRIVHARDGHGLRDLPVRRGEGHRTRRDRALGRVAHAQRHRHVGGRLRGQHDREPRRAARLVRRAR